MVPLLFLGLLSRPVSVSEAYVEPSPEGVEIQPDGGRLGSRALLRTLPPGQKLVWYVKVTKAGSFRVVPRYTVTEVDGKRASPRIHVLGPKVGWRRIELSGTLPAPLEGIQVDETSTAEYAFPDNAERRGTASVHLGYRQADGSEWVYQEAVARTDPLWTYYCAIGWHRGYFGFQVNSPTERRIIFSVWDAGNEAVDRDKVGDDLRVKLVEKGPGVVAGDFGNEGTGGHSHLVYPWRRGQRMRFLVHAVPQDGATLYSGWFWDRGAWRLVARMRAPKDGATLSHLYSFDENFNDPNGQLLRECDFGPFLYRGHGNGWQAATEARFTIDALGRQRREDVGVTPLGGAWRLWTGGYRPRTAEFGQTFRAATTRLPDVGLPE